MSSAVDTLAALDRLERRFDGPVPEPLRQLARHGSAIEVRLLQAVGQAAFFRQMVRGQIRAIRLRRATGTGYPEMLDDLHLYHRQWQGWRRQIRFLTAQKEAESPPSTVRMWPLT